MEAFSICHFAAAARRDPSFPPARADSRPAPLLDEPGRLDLYRQLTAAVAQSAGDASQKWLLSLITHDPSRALAEIALTRYIDALAAGARLHSLAMIAASDTCPRLPRRRASECLLLDRINSQQPVSPQALLTASHWCQRRAAQHATGRPLALLAEAGRTAHVRVIARQRLGEGSRPSPDSMRREPVSGRGRQTTGANGSNDTSTTPTASASIEEPTMTFEVNETADGYVRWCLRASGGDEVAHSGENLSTRANAKRAARRFSAHAAQSKFEIYRSGDHYRWRARANNGYITASSAGRFPTASNAQRAADDVRENAGVAAGP